MGRRRNPEPKGPAGAALLTGRVLVGMRRDAYVSDARAELHRPFKQGAHFESWQKLTEEMAKIF